MKAKLTTFAIAFVVAACASGTMDMMDGSGDSAIDATMDATIADATVDVPANDGSASGGDALPLGTVGFFHANACPAGWSTYAPAVGRLILPSSTMLSSVNGTALADRADIGMHSHAYGGSIPIANVEYATSPTGTYAGLASATDPVIAGTSQPASLGLPYVHLLPCRKLTDAAASAPALTAGVVVPFSLTTCPSGWQPLPALDGRFVVGLPPSATNSLTFGGAPLTSTANVQHAHTISGQINVTPRGVSTATGIGSGPYAASGLVAYSLDTDVHSDTLPFVRLLYCEKM